MELTSEIGSKYFAVSLFVSNGIFLCTIIIAGDKVLVPVEATVPVTGCQAVYVESLHYPEA
jgi:hypothetical protein